MSLILKGIDLPNSGQIEIIIRPHGKVFSKTRGISAEAIQIPNGHGRLIDEDTFICRMDDSFRMAGLNGTDYRKVKRWLKNAQTILEAEE